MKILRCSDNKPGTPVKLRSGGVGALASSSESGSGQKRRPNPILRRTRARSPTWLLPGAEKYTSADEVARKGTEAERSGVVFEELDANLHFKSFKSIYRL